jgi:rod shape-determining protein MreB
LEIMVKGRDYVTGLPKSVPLSTLDVVEAISNELDEMMGAIKKVLHDTPPELAADIIDNGIIMTGGSSQLRGLTDLVHRETGVRARLADDPLQCVIRGIGEALQHTDLYKRALLSKR